jgi:hypothetical protein
MRFCPPLASVVAALAVFLLTTTSAAPAHVHSNYNVPGGYYAYTYGYRPLPAKQSCYDLSRSIVEPYTKYYTPRSSLSFMDTSVPKAFWQWTGNITLSDFMRAKSHKVCSHCVLLHYRIKDRRLYVEKGADTRVPPPGKVHRMAWEEMLSIALYLFPLPDMEFVLKSDDDCIGDKPFFQANVCRQSPRAGFAMPYC